MSMAVVRTGMQLGHVVHFDWRYDRYVCCRCGATARWDVVLGRHSGTLVRQGSKCFDEEEVR